MVPEEITPLVPAVVGEKVADDQTCFILETLLKYMVIQVRAKFPGERLNSCFLRAVIIHGDGGICYYGVACLAREIEMFCPY